MADTGVTGPLRAIISHPVSRLLIGLVAVVSALVIVSLGWVLLTKRMDLGPWGEVVHALAMALAAMGAYAAFVRWVERRPVTDLGRKGAVSEWAIGVALGVLVISLTVGIIAALGGYRITGWNPPSVLVPVLALAITSGVIEEIITRGLIFRLLEEWLGSWTALVLSALFFGFMHILNPNATLMAAAAISIEAGILLGALYMLTRRLWMAIGLHMAWNFTQGGIYGINVSGIEVPGLLYNTMQGPPMLTGGAFGAEASLPAILLCTALGLGVLYLAHRRGRFVAASGHRFRTGRPDPAHLPAEA